MSLLKHCADGNLTEIKSILNDNRLQRNELNAPDEYNWTCLHHAVKSGSVDCIKFLLTFEKLDTHVETIEGETALHIACTMPNISSEIVSLLIEADPDLINFVNNKEEDLLRCAIKRHRLDIVKLLIKNGAPVNRQDSSGNTALHIAVIKSAPEIVRYLLAEANIDATIRNREGLDACFRLFMKLIVHYPILSQAQIDYFEEVVQFTYNLQDLSKPKEIDNMINEMIMFGYHYQQNGNRFYAPISRLFRVPPSKQYFFEKILNSNVRSCHCLVSILMDINADSLPPLLWGQLCVELFMLCIADESFFDEYISEIMSTGWNTLLKDYQVRNLFEFVRELNTLEPRILFHFLKTLILYGIDIDPLMRYTEFTLAPIFIETVLVPLDRAVLPRYQSSYPNGCHKIFSLKDMCRNTLRSYYFKTYPHYLALKALYSLDAVPVKIRNFLCYNVMNFEL